MALQFNQIKYSASTALLSLIILLWVFSIPVKNSVYQISTIFIALIFIVTSTLERVKIKAFSDKYLDVIITFSLIPLTMLFANLVNGITDSKPWLDTLKYIYRHPLVLLALLYFYETNRLSKRNLTFVCLATLTFYALDGCMEAFSMFTSGQSAPIKGLTFNQNIFGLVMLSAFVMSCITFFETYSRKQKINILFNIIAVVGIGIFLLLLILSHSRAAWISAVAFFIAMAVSQPKYLKMQVLIAALFLSCSGMLIYTSDELQHRFMLLVQLYDSYRFEAWLGAVSAIIQKPLFGHGLVDFDTIVKVSITSVHNSILEILLTTGIFGLTAYIFVIYISAIEIIKSKRFLYFAAVISFLIISQFDHSIYNSKTFNSILTILAFYIFSSRKEAIALPAKQN